MKFGLLLNTVKYLKPIQIYFRLFYVVRAFLRKTLRFQYKFDYEYQSAKTSLKPSILSYVSYQEQGRFTFLNQEHDFFGKVDWNLSKYGKLWTYNLNYFDFLNQKSMTREGGLILIEDYLSKLDSLKDGLEPFPISLRGINWIKFMIRNDVQNHKIDSSLYSQYLILCDNLEYHLLGNHLLENAFSLLFAAYYFRNQRFYKLARKILKKELAEQILNDGAHYELSPMYHQLMLFRVLDCINLVQNNSWQNHELSDFLIGKAQVMLGWLKQITYANGDIPHLNDSTDLVAPCSKDLFKYAEDLGLKSQQFRLHDSGYRIFKSDFYEMVIDVGQIGPDYIPGHGHCDMLSFELRVYGKPIIVDTGVSTYEANEQRQFERSTCAHNTVFFPGSEQSQVWSSFRVGLRARMQILNETDHSIDAQHDGYLKSHKTIHKRQFVTNKSEIMIHDELIGSKDQAIATFHIHPCCDVRVDENRVHIENTCFTFSNSDSIEIKPVTFADGFNKVLEAKVVHVKFCSKLLTRISF